MKTLQEIRDSAAAKYDDVFLDSDHLNPSDINLAFVAGFDLAASHLSEEIETLNTEVCAACVESAKRIDNLAAENKRLTEMLEGKKK